MPSPLENLLKARLEGATRLVVLGVGSELRCDDGAGPAVVRRLACRFARTPPAVPVHLIDGGAAPENFTGEIRRLAPSHVLVLDAAWMGLPAGRVAFIETSEIGGVSACSHAMPIALLTDYLAHSMPVTVLVLGIQPASVEFAARMTQAVSRAAGRVAGMIGEVITPS